MIPIIKKISTEEAVIIRHPVLREGKPIDSCKFTGDDFTSTFHLGAFLNNKLLGVVTILNIKNSLFTNDNQFQLRGMAILSKFQRKGIGISLVSNAEERVKELDGNLIWLNSREIAVDFYRKMGFEIFGKEFNIPKIGLHSTMVKYL